MDDAIAKSLAGGIVVIDVERIDVIADLDEPCRHPSRNRDGKLLSHSDRDVSERILVHVATLVRIKSIMSPTLLSVAMSSRDILIPKSFSIATTRLICAS